MTVLTFQGKQEKKVYKSWIVYSYVYMNECPIYFFFSIKYIL